MIADLHIHSKYSRATSLEMDILNIGRYAQKKGLDVVATGDFTHSRWLNELKDSLVELSGSGLYAPRGDRESAVRFIVSTEVCTIFNWNGKARKIHHVILAPSIDVAEQINDRLSRFGDLTVDGRPTLSMTAAQLVEETLEVSCDNLIFPAHAWTPWFSIFGANSGFDRLEECYQDMSDRVFALETGLSSDPPMNWRLSSLDRLTLLSNSDCHSAWPWRIGRESNVLQLERVNYDEIVGAIRVKDPTRFRFTIETDPAYGKYHWTGHRACNISMSSHEAIRLGGLCPRCHRKMTKGVEQRVEELADRHLGYKPQGAPTFIHLLPLSEIVAIVVGAEQPSTRTVWRIYNTLIEKFGNEYAVLLDASREDIRTVADEKVADGIDRVRKHNFGVTPGYDGVYGKMELRDAPNNEGSAPASPTWRLEDFI